MTCHIGHDWTRVLTWLSLLTVIVLTSERRLPAADLNPANTTKSDRVYFTTDIVPTLTRLGCNSGGCHGKATGQNGFRLSLFGFEPELDYAALVHEGRGRRLFAANPANSLLLLKATARMPHGGGRRMDETSDDYRLVFNWIIQGAASPRSEDPKLLQIDLSPTDQILNENSTLQLRLIARFSDGASRDVTRQSVYQSNEPGIASVNDTGLVTTTTQHGLVSVMARFGEQIATFHGVVPFTADATTTKVIQSRLDELEQQLAGSPIDQLMLRQWRRLNVIPSVPADDPTFLRRATIDLCGTLPTIDEINQFQSETRRDKRSQLIDRLLDRSEYASYFALKWADILQNRGSGYATSKQRAGTTLFAGWIRDSIADNKPYDQFVTEIITATGRQSENPPTVWYRTVRKPQEYVESVAQAFLGVRIQCAQCHHHPTESWSQSDYFGLAAVFGRVGRKGGFADAEVPTDELIFLADQSQVKHPRTGATLPARPLGGADFALNPSDDPRQSLARWMTDPNNPYFARTMVNRMWAHFMGRGIIHPIDDARSTNPPSNPELIDTLAKEFIASGFDVKQLIRSITATYAYGLDSTPQAGNVTDAQSFARFVPRRLTAEVLLDAISQVLDVPTAFPGLPPGTRAIELPDENVAAHFLDVFGRPGRMSACECERVDAPALNQALELVNSAEIQRKLTSDTGYVKRLAAGERSNHDRVNEAFLRVLARPPRPEELQIAVEFLDSEKDRAEAIRSLLWSLLATNEFLFNH